MRVRFATNDPTPWPPEVPAGENPPPGAIIDYYLGANASQAVKLEILDGAGKLVRSYTSDDKPPATDPAMDPDKYNQICQTTPNAPDCGLPLYWPAPTVTLSNQKGMHRFNWDMRYDPISAGGGGRGGGGSGGAVPHRTYSSVNSPWAPPGAYTVRLTVDGKSYTQPLTLRLDPRVKTPALALAQLRWLKRRLSVAPARHAAYLDARALYIEKGIGAIAQLDKAQGDDVAAFKARLDSIAPAAAQGGGGRGGRGGGGGGGRGAVPTDTTQGTRCGRWSWSRPRRRRNNGLTHAGRCEQYDAVGCHVDPGCRGRANLRPARCGDAGARSVRSGDGSMECAQDYWTCGIEREAEGAGTGGGTELERRRGHEGTARRPAFGRERRGR